MKKYCFFLFLILSFFILFLIIRFVPKKYILNYDFNKYYIKESYNNGLYIFIINYNNVEIPFLIKHKYSAQRRLINNITVDAEKLTIKVFNEEYSVNIVDSQLLLNLTFPSLEIIKTNGNINFYSTFAEKIVAWNYYGFFNIDNKKVYDNKVFSGNNYSSDLLYKYGNYLLVPDYDSKYEFNNMYLFDISNNNKIELNSEYTISYNSYYLGIYDKSIYLIDRKYKNEYEININKKEINLINKNEMGIIYSKANKKEKISMTKLVNSDYSFNSDNIYNYNIKNGFLYLNIEDIDLLVINKNVDRIIYCNNDTVYFLIGSILYKYQYNKSVLPLVSYEEWNFNSNNNIFIYE